MKIIKTVYVLIPLNIFLALKWAPPVRGLGDLSRILFFHVPWAWVSLLAFLIAALYSLIYLFDKKNKFYSLEKKSYNSAFLGIIFTILTIVSGSCWAKLSWGSFWNWDPRETSIVVLLLIYIAYFSLLSSMPDSEKKHKIGAIYLILAIIIAPFFMFVIPRIYPSLHPDPFYNFRGKRLH